MRRAKWFLLFMAIAFVAVLVGFGLGWIVGESILR